MKTLFLALLMVTALISAEKLQAQCFSDTDELGFSPSADKAEQKAAEDFLAEKLQYEMSTSCWSSENPSSHLTERLLEEKIQAFVNFEFTPRHEEEFLLMGSECFSSKP